MDIAVIAHKMHREWIRKIFSIHSDFNGRIVCFVDWVIPISDKIEDDIPVISMEQLHDFKYDTVFIAVPWPGRANQLFLTLYDKRIKGTVYSIRATMIEAERDFIKGEEFDFSIVDKISKSDTRPFLQLLETHVCDDCNLNCKACTHFAPFVNKRQKADIKKFEESMQKLSQLFSGIGLISILGGEALLEPSLCMEMIKKSRRYFPRSGIMLTTNGLLVSKMKPEFWECIRENGAFVNVTPYPPIIKSVPAILDIFHKYNIKYDPRIETNEIKTFAKFMSLEAKYDANLNNEICAGAGCYQLQDGYIGKCPEGMYIDFMADSLGKEPSELKTKDLVNIMEADDGFAVLRKLCAPSDMCGKCAKIFREDISWARIDSPPNPDDWLICREQ